MTKQDDKLIKKHEEARASAEWTISLAYIEASTIRAARAMLDWSGERLAKESGVSISTIKRAERNGTSIPAIATAIETALSKGGIEFLERGIALRGGSEAP